MANQRSKDKRYVSAWIPSRLNDLLILVAKSRGIAKSDLVNELLAAEAEKHGVNSAPVTRVADGLSADAVAVVRRKSRKPSAAQ